MDDVSEYVSAQTIKRFSKDSILVHQGELPSALYAIRSGYAKIYDLSADGSEQLLGLAGKFDFIPSEILFSDLTAAQFFYAAYTPIEVYCVDSGEFMRRVRDNSQALYRIIQSVTHKYHGLLQHLTAVQKPKAREKIVAVLQFLAVHFGSDQPPRGLSPSSQLRSVPLPLTQQDIANLVGVTRETAAHELKLLKNEGYISYNKSYFFVSEKLANLVV